MKNLITAVTVFVFCLIVLIAFWILQAIATGINTGLIQNLNSL